MTGGATILDDRETVELLCGRPELLAIADAVRATNGRRTRSALRRTQLLVGAAVACTAAAASIVFFGVSGSRPAANGPLPTTIAADAPAGPVPLSRAIRDASSSFGAPLILPDTPVLKPSDAESTAFEQWVPSPAPGVQEPLSQVTVEFSSPDVSIAYTPTALDSWGSRHPDPLDRYRAEIAQSTDPAGYRIVSLSGTPALLDAGKTGNSIEFRLGKLSITIWAPDNDGVPTTVDGPTIRALAQSIVDQASEG